MAGLIGVLGGCSTEDGSAPSGGVAVVESPAPVTPSQARPTARTTQKKVVVETKAVPFRRVTVEDASLEEGRRVVTKQGKLGIKRLTYEVTITNGVQTGKRLLRQVVVRQPVTQVTAVGTKVVEEPAGNCDPNYSGGCVPVASDVDCAGGSGNGPAYVEGPVDVVGTDVYDLDRDNDGIGCED